MCKLLFCVLILFSITMTDCNKKKTTLKMDKKTFIPGDEIKVYFTAPASFEADAWVGMVPSYVSHGHESENDKFDLDYFYLDKRTSGELLFRAPDDTGSYDFRMNDTDKDGYEVACITFRVKYTDVTLRINKTTFTPGEDIKVYFTAPSVYPPSAWIGIIPTDIPHGSETENDKYVITYKNYGGSISGELYFSAPEPGVYDVRMHDTAGRNGHEVAHVTFEVKWQ